MQANLHNCKTTTVTLWGTPEHESATGRTYVSIDITDGEGGHVTLFFDDALAGAEFVAAAAEAATFLLKAENDARTAKLLADLSEEVGLPLDSDL